MKRFERDTNELALADHRLRREDPLPARLRSKLYADLLTAFASRLKLTDVATQEAIWRIGGAGL